MVFLFSCNHCICRMWSLLMLPDTPSLERKRGKKPMGWVRRATLFFQGTVVPQRSSTAHGASSRVGPDPWKSALHPAFVGSFPVYWVKPVQRGPTYFSGVGPEHFFPYWQTQNLPSRKHSNNLLKSFRQNDKWPVGCESLSDLPFECSNPLLHTRLHSWNILYLATWRICVSPRK